MQLRTCASYKVFALVLLLCATGMLASTAAAQEKLSIKPVTEKKLAKLPPGPLFWRIDTFPTLAEAQTAAGPTALAAEIQGKVWLFTLGSKGGSSTGDTGRLVHGAPELVARAGQVPDAMRHDEVEGRRCKRQPIHGRQQQASAQARTRRGHARNRRRHHGQ